MKFSSIYIVRQTTPCIYYFWGMAMMRYQIQWSFHKNFYKTNSYLFNMLQLISKTVILLIILTCWIFGSKLQTGCLSFWLLCPKAILCHTSRICPSKIKSLMCLSQQFIKKYFLYSVKYIVRHFSIFDADATWLNKYHDKQLN